MPPSTFVHLAPGDPAPWFKQASTSNPNYNFDTVAGRHVVLCFFAAAGDPRSKAALAAAYANRALFDDARACFFGISIDPSDRAEQRVRELLPGMRFFWDFDRKVSRLYGAVARDAPAEGPLPPVRRFWVLLDPALRVVSVIPFAADGSDGKLLFDRLKQVCGATAAAEGRQPVPVLWLPRVFEPELCHALIAAYERDGGEESGFMRDIGGRTALVHDHGHKRRRDSTISDAPLISTIQNRVQRRITPEILKVHHFDATRMERYIVACYAAEDGGHFRAHRDNTTKGTAHRRFAVSINLNDDFEGGEIHFPEYGPQGFRPPVGGAVVFSCSLLHAVSPVTKGRRFAFLPFLYDEAAARIREANHPFLGAGYEYKA
jgi:peroxiredoxin/predicted 2-oxoglutarate/Fe(II)-dependent dioxygenase YbiX